MHNKVHYIKAADHDYAMSVKKAMVYALTYAKKYSIGNIKIVLSHSNVFDEGSNVYQGLEALLQDQVKALKKNMNLPIYDFLPNNEILGINVLLANNKLFWTPATKTICVLIFATEDKFLKIASQLHFTEIPLIAVVHNPTSEIDRYLSATQGANMLLEEDSSVTPFSEDSLPAEIKLILGKLISINVTKGASHLPTKDRMALVIKELISGKHEITLTQFLGYLVNVVGLPINESVELLNRHHKYFQ